MEEDFQESEVIFTDHDQNTQTHSNSYFSYREMVVNSQTNSRVSRKKQKSKKKKKNDDSAPINIPENIFRCVDSEDFEDEYDFDGEMVPPHVIVGRRIAGKMAFSVCTGNGRTLKGRDLSEVRNSILRMTGFLET
ncbi:hypothetical protein L1049_010240 [Liquidambar formosana]|uniref:Senescence regulator n=1 Tax=Liquidambar formosana TaxID=63359 RepID=A0AAP0NAQ2_LIQFO